MEPRENQSIAYTAMKQLHPARKSAPRHGYDFEKIGLVTGRGQGAHGISGMTKDRPEERAGIGSPCATRVPASQRNLTGLGMQRGRTRRQVGDVQ